MTTTPPAQIYVEAVNGSFIQISADESIRMELSEQFTFDLPEAKFMGNFKRGGRSRGSWDGKIRLYSKRNSQLPIGLLDSLHLFAKERGYTIDISSGGRSGSLWGRAWSVAETEAFGNDLPISGANNSRLTLRPDQLDAITRAIRGRRSLIVSPTASGKSAIAYSIALWQSTMVPKSRGLVLVPRVQLCQQLFSDWSAYSRLNGFDIEHEVSVIYAGRDKHKTSRITISTWQSLYELPPEYFEQFTYVIGDEAHEFKAKSLTYIMNSCVNAWDRTGLTGTLDGTVTNKMVLEGLFGPVQKIITSKELMNKGAIAKLNPIKVLLLKHPKDKCKVPKVTESDYENEIQYLIGSEERNNFITNLALSLKGNTLLLYQRVANHGVLLHDLLKEKKKNVYLIHGGVEMDEREEIRRIVEKENDAIIVASYGTFSTGINIRNLHNVIFGSPSKSRIRNLQSIGRGLRIGDDKDSATLFDIADDLRTSETGRRNFTYLHMEERLKIYIEEKFPYKMYNIQLGTVNDKKEADAKQQDEDSRTKKEGANEKFGLLKF